ncbi:MAG: hypothetical protein ACOY45_09045 [Pseudomonadota bacterium]
MLKRLSILAPMALACTAVAAPAAQAQDDPAVTVEDLQGAMEGYFGRGYNITIRNWREPGGDTKGWSMLRKVTAATTIRRCFTRLETPTILEKRNSDPVAYYGIDFAAVRNVQWDGDRTLMIVADHMKPGEHGALILDTAENAEMVEAVFLFMMEECGGG